ncbi:MAG: hypothetical protein ACI9FD_004165 [Gammaproteobacteria bacterium]|jgi:hypothetical protein
MTTSRHSSIIAAITFLLASSAFTLPASAHTDLVCATQCFHGGGGTVQECAARCVGHTHSGGSGSKPASGDKTTESDDTEYGGQRILKLPMQHVVLRSAG